MPAQRDPLDRRVPQVLLDRLDLQVQLEQREQLDLRVQLVLLDCLEALVQLVQRDQLDRREQQVHPDPLVQRDLRALPRMLHSGRRILQRKM